MARLYTMARTVGVRRRPRPRVILVKSLPIQNPTSAAEHAGAEESFAPKHEATAGAPRRPRRTPPSPPSSTRHRRLLGFHPPSWHTCFHQPPSEPPRHLHRRHARRASSQGCARLPAPPAGDVTTSRGNAPCVAHVPASPSGASARRPFTSATPGRTPLRREPVQLRDREFLYQT